MTTTTAPRYRKTQAGQWVVLGPASVVRQGDVTVSKADGSSKSEYIDSVGKSLDVAGVRCCYGYPAERVPRRSRYDSGDYPCKSGTGDCWTFGVRDCRACGS